MLNYRIFWNFFKTGVFFKKIGNSTFLFLEGGGLLRAQRSEAPKHCNLLTRRAQAAELVLRQDIFDSSTREFQIHGTNVRPSFLVEVADTTITRASPSVTLSCAGPKWEYVRLQTKITPPQFYNTNPIKIKHTQKNQI